MFEKVVLELGGNVGRLPHAIDLAKQNDAFLLVSSEGDPAQCLNLIRSAGIPADRFYLDYTAWDTLTNFTCTYRRIRDYGTKTLWVVTDGFHMKRSMRIADAVYFRRDINLIASPSSPADHQEDPGLVRDDTIRAWIWRATNYITAVQNVYDDRIGYLQDCYYQARELQ